jgi:hypothetical protein
MIESNWHFDLGTARTLWRTELMMWDADLAVKALANLARRQSYKIVLADFVETLEMLNRNLKQEAKRAAAARAIETGRRGYAPPEWVLVWSWARGKALAAWEKARTKQPDRTLLSFPQQGDWADPRKTMTTAEYEALREEWIAAGSPREKVRVVMEL